MISPSRKHPIIYLKGDLQGQKIISKSKGTKYSENWGSLQSDSNPAKGNHTQLESQSKFCFKEKNTLACDFLFLGSPTTNSEDEQKSSGPLNLNSAIPADVGLGKFNISSRHVENCSIIQRVKC